MAERAFVIKKSFLFSEELDVSKCDISGGVDDEWNITDDGWVSDPYDLGTIVGADLGPKDTCVFKFHSSVPGRLKEDFYRGLKRTLAERKA